MSDASTDSAEPLHDEEFSPQILTSAVPFSGAVWDVREDRFRYNGDEITRHYVDHPGAVAVVVLDEDDRVLLIQQYRHPIRQRDWELPAGLLDIDGEDELTAAQRELAEETDLVAEHWERLLSTFTTPGGSDEVVHFFLATGLSAAPDTHARADEEADIRVEWMPLDDAVTAVLEGRMRNALLVNGILTASARRARA